MINYLVSGPPQSDGSVILYASTSNGGGIYRYVDYPFSGPNLTGSWSYLTQIIKNSKKGVRCTLKGRLNIQNTGNKNSSSAHVKFYLSDDDVYDEADTFAKKMSVGNIGASKNKNVSLNYNSPYNVITSGKYVIVVFDADNKIAETNEHDNILIYGPLP